MSIADLSSFTHLSPTTVSAVEMIQGTLARSEVFVSPNSDEVLIIQGDSCVIDVCGPDTMCAYTFQDAEGTEAGFATGWNA